MLLQITRIPKIPLKTLLFFCQNSFPKAVMSSLFFLTHARSLELNPPFTPTTHPQSFVNLHTLAPSPAEQDETTSGSPSMSPGASSHSSTVEIIITSIFAATTLPNPRPCSHDGVPQCAELCMHLRIPSAQHSTWYTMAQIMGSVLLNPPGCLSCGHTCHCSLHSK